MGRGNGQTFQPVALARRPERGPDESLTWPTHELPAHPSDDHFDEDLAGFHAGWPSGSASPSSSSPASGPGDAPLGAEANGSGAERRGADAYKHHGGDPAAEAPGTDPLRQPVDAQPDGSAVGFAGPPEGAETAGSEHAEDAGQGTADTAASTADDLATDPAPLPPAPDSERDGGAAQELNSAGPATDAGEAAEPDSGVPPQPDQPAPADDSLPDWGLPLTPLDLVGITSFLQILLAWLPDDVPGADRYCADGLDAMAAANEQRAPDEQLRAGDLASFFDNSDLRQEVHSQAKDAGNHSSFDPNSGTYNGLDRAKRRRMAEAVRRAQEESQTKGADLSEARAHQDELAERVAHHERALRGGKS